METQSIDKPVEREAVREPKRPWFEPVSAILMGVASLCTAWCSYQSSSWSGESSAFDTSADKLERSAVAMHLESGQVERTQLGLLTEAVNAKLAGDEKRERFYTTRFADELKPAYEKWIALNPFENPKAPPHPFVPGFYTPRFDQEIRDAKAESDRLEQQSRISGQHASAYLSNTVLLASVMLFAGTADKFDQRRVRTGALLFALSIFAFAVFRMLTLPVA